MLQMLGSCDVEGKVYPRTGLEGPEEKRYTSTLSLTSALNGSG
jgi:hypothetical protein